jgi:hypothetical protein
MTEAAPIPDAKAAKKPSKKKLRRKADLIAFEIAIAAGTLVALANMSKDYESVSHSAEFLGKVIRRRAEKLMGLLDAMEPVDLNRRGRSMTSPAAEAKAIEIGVRGGSRRRGMACEKADLGCA